MNTTPQNPIAWTEVYVEDMTRARKFYESVLGIEMQVDEMPGDAEAGSGESFEMVMFHGDMAAPGSSGALVKSSMFQPGTGGTLVYFACEDCSVEISRVAAAGGKVLQEKMSIGEYGFCGTCIDTEGNTIGFYSMK